VTWEALYGLICTKDTFGRAEVAILLNHFRNDVINVSPNINCHIDIPYRVIKPSS